MFFLEIRVMLGYPLLWGFEAPCSTWGIHLFLSCTESPIDFKRTDTQKIGLCTICLVLLLPAPRGLSTHFPVN